MSHTAIPLPTLAATEQLAQKLAPLLRAGDVLALQGELGAGKTTFARALLHALGVTGEVPSPTFTLVQTYDTRGLIVYHFDLYRLKNASELDELGWDDACADGAVIVEWPERVAARMPDDKLTLRFTTDDKGVRCCTVKAQDVWQQRLKDVSL